MTPTRRFAENTTVKPSKTLEEIESLLTRYGYAPRQFELERGKGINMWVLRVQCDSFTLRFNAAHHTNPRSRLTDYEHRIRAGQRLLRVALLMIKGKFEEMAGQGELGITIENVAVNMPANFELEDGGTVADKIKRTKWMKKISQGRPLAKTKAIAKR